MYSAVSGIVTSSTAVVVGGWSIKGLIKFFCAAVAEDGTEIGSPEVLSIGSAANPKYTPLCNSEWPDISKPEMGMFAVGIPSFEGFMLVWGFWCEK